MQSTIAYISFLGHELATEISEASTAVDVVKGSEILKEGQYIKVLPIVLEGLVKVYSSF